MKHKTLAAIFILWVFIFKAEAQNPNLTWAGSIGGTGDDAGQAIGTDDSGNVYISGYFSNTADFDPGPAVYNLTSNGSADIFIEKLDATGNFIWAKRIGGPGDDQVYSLALDHIGNIYLTGFFNGLVDFDGGTGVSDLTSNGAGDIFIEKIDLNGNFIWAKAVGESNQDEGIAIATDPSGKPVVTGFFGNTVDFDPGPGIYNLTETAGLSVYILKLDTSGNFIFATAFTGAGVGIANSIACDGQGNIYTTGRYGGTIDFDPGPGTYNLTSLVNSLGMGSDIFIQKSDMNGNFLWANSKGSVSNIYDAAFSIIADSIGNVYTAGYLADTIDFDPGPGVFNLISHGLNDIFIQKLDPTGNLLWAENFGGTNGSDVNNMALDAFGNIYIPGSFGDTVDFDPGPGTHYLISHGYVDIYILKLNAAGNFVWVAGMGGSPNGGDGWAVAVNNSGSVFTTGYYIGTCDFDPNAGISNLTSAGQGDIFIMKLDQTVNGIDQYQIENNMTIYPNPSNGLFSIVFPEDHHAGKFELFDATSKMLYSKNIDPASGKTIDLSHLSKGMYYIRFTTDGKIYYSKLIIG